MAVSLTGLVFRLIKGAPLSAAEGDDNTRLIQNFVNGLAQIIGFSLNPDGTLAAGALSRADQIGNKPKIADTLSASESLPAGVFNAGVYGVTNDQITAYVAGMRVKFLASAASTGISSVQFNPAATVPLAVVPIKKGVNLDLAANDILASAVVELVYDGTNFQLVGMETATAAAADINAGTDDAKKVTSKSIKSAHFVSNSFALITGVIANQDHGLGAAPYSVRWVLVCTGTPDAGYALLDEVPAGLFMARVSNSTVEFIAPAYAGGANATKVFMSGLNMASQTVSISHKTTGALTPIDPTFWRAKCYACMI